MQQMTQQPLNDAQLDRLGDFLEGVGAPAMNLEMLDGFFAALICGPETEVSPHFFLRDQALGGPGDSELAHFWLFFTQIPASPLVCAMSAVGHCGDNAACEGLFGMLKRKRIYRTKYPTLDAARTDVFE